MREECKMAEISANGKPRMVATNSQKIRKNTSRNTGFRNAVSAEELSFAEINPILFYTNVCGNVEQEYTRDEIDSQLKTEFISALQPALGRLSDAEMIKQAQRTAIMRDPTMAAATPVGAQADTMKAAASNEGGAMNAGGMNAQNLFAMGQQQTQQTASSAPDADGWKCACGATVTGKFCPKCGAKKPEPVQSGAWKCKCGATATGKFCPECGSPKPAEDGWACSCGTVNKGKFCQNCGARKPEGAPLYRCDKCGWEPEDPHNPPKFCPECGDLFDDREWNNYRYEFDTSKCDRSPELYKSVVRIFEIASNKEIWKIGVCLKEGEF